MENKMKDLIKKQDKELERFLSWSDFGINIEERQELKKFLDKVRKETAECEKKRIKEKVKDWRRGFSMTCAESDIYEKAHQQILKALDNLK